MEAERLVERPTSGDISSALVLWGKGNSLDVGQTEGSLSACQASFFLLSRHNCLSSQRGGK